VTPAGVWYLGSPEGNSRQPPATKAGLIFSESRNAEQVAEKHIFAAWGAKPSYSFEGSYRSAGSAAPPKIGVFPESVQEECHG
jgi:hypothetical protein